MRWTITIEATDEFGSAHWSQIEIEKDFEGLENGCVGFPIEDGKAIMAHLQQVIVKQQCEAYVLARRFCVDCQRFRASKTIASAKSERCLAASRSATELFAHWPLLHEQGRTLGAV